MYLVDTNVVSEARKGKKANTGVQKFWKEADPADIYISAQTIGEIRRGVENIRYRGDASQAELLEAWLDIVVTQYADRVLSFDVDCAQVWGKLMSPHPQHPIDKQIASIALIHNMTVVTRNVVDFESTGVQLENPFVNTTNYS
ncbi:MAG: type II toxin-antitoxin system VapC family toxin [Methylotenera sp.]|nr:type II toxin-antitoxin system VapC family toxin [Methylotenera sp.]MDO9233248.1 type II toxin-antitoxin system VapC family toxin [Methylotenera sp.]MDO9389012.1 type II toxin-antitoxin system VapC family toxin [Methylotenera sp.]MDP1597441.1 type II toxin-antitoxin system VapC family toxin [Methylotenera sp.]MDP1754026.1 type II toxin-antitoxin system VapC family toxin [Methylotenera sp.]